MCTRKWRGARILYKMGVEFVLTNRKKIGIVEKIKKGGETMNCQEVRRVFKAYYRNEDVEIDEIEGAYRHTLCVDGFVCGECSEYLEKARKKLNCEETCKVFYVYYCETPRNDELELIDIEKAYEHTFTQRGVRCEKCNKYLERVKDKKKAV